MSTRMLEGTVLALGSSPNSGAQNTKKCSDDLYLAKENFAERWSMVAPHSELGKNLS